MIKVDKFDKLKEVDKYLSLHETEYWNMFKHG